MRKAMFLVLISVAVTALLTGCEQMGGGKVTPIQSERRTVQRSPRTPVTGERAAAVKPFAHTQPAEPKESRVVEAAPRAGESNVIIGSPVAPTKETQAFYGKELIVADFDSGEKPNNLGGNFGAWDKDPADFSQGARESFDSVNKYGAKGFGMKITYDVDSPNPAYNGFWMFLQGLDASGYNNLAFWVKGDPEGYTTVFKIELKNAKGEVGRYYVSSVTGEWQRVTIPLRDFNGITDFSNLTEFVIVFEDRIVSNKDGAIYIDEATFTKQ